jgi:hypothetical protein
MEYKTKRSPLTISLLLAATFAAGFGAALLTTTMQDITANASILADATETKESVAKSNNSAINLAEKPFLVEQGKTVAVTPINVTHIQISLAGNGTIMLPNSTETVKTKDTGNAIARSTPTGNIAQGQIFINTEDRSENGTVFFTEIGQNGKGIGVAYFSTNSTGKLAFLDNMVAVLQDELQPNGNTVISVFEWRGRNRWEALEIP